MLTGTFWTVPPQASGNKQEQNCITNYSTSRVGNEDWKGKIPSVSVKCYILDTSAYKFVT